MTEEEWLEDYQEEQYGKELEKLAVLYYQTPGSIKQQILSMMSDSDIALIIGDKRKEWGLVEFEKKTSLKGLRGDNRKILEGIFLDKQEEINQLIRALQYILKCRQGGNQGGFNSEDLQRAKDSIPILEVVQIILGQNLKYKKLVQIKCPFMGHNEKTASFNIYTNTNSCFCEGCKRGGSQIDFIMHTLGCSNGEAINKFLTLYKK